MKKRFLKNLIPDYRFKKISDIPLAVFEGKQWVILDVDNTLVYSGTVQTEQKVLDWVESLKRNHSCIIFSNSFNFYKRADAIEKLFNCPVFLSHHRKPERALFEQMKKAYGFKARDLAVVGDLIFTDILFGNTNGAATILVDALGSRESIIFKLTRKLQEMILYFFGATHYN